MFPSVPSPPLKGNEARTPPSAEGSAVFESLSYSDVPSDHD